MAPSLSSGLTLKRIHREIADLKKEDLGRISIAPSTDNLFKWTASIPGQEGSPYEGGCFEVEINIPTDYPFSAPKVTFLTRIYHMNISDRGGVCIDILKQNWSPALSIFKVILSLSSLLTDPNPQDPLVPSIATEYVRNRSQHDKTAKRWTELYASSSTQPSPPSPPIPVHSLHGMYFSMPIFPSHLMPTRRAPRVIPPPAPSTSEPIEIEDSEGESESAPSSSSRNRNSSSGKRKRDGSCSSRTSKRGRPSEAGSDSREEVIILED